MAQTNRLDLDLSLATTPTSAGGEFQSLLFGPEEADLSHAHEPPFFADLNLDQVVAAVVAGRDEYDLKPFFYIPVRDVEAVTYRHEVLRDLETDQVRATVRAFGDEMRRVRQYLTLATKQYFKYEKERWFLDAASVYCNAVSAFGAALDGLELSSRGMQSLRELLANYTDGEGFTRFAAEARGVLDGLADVKYTVRIKGSRVTVTTYQEETDYSSEIEETFARFRQGAVEDHRVKIPDSDAMDHVEAQIAQLVARLYPREFRSLDEFCARNRDFVDPRLARFDREAQFYLAYLEHTERLAATGLRFCYPTVSTQSKDVEAEDAFDIAMAAKLTASRTQVVCNDLVLQAPERVLVVTGPNQGGKSTFARMFGQLHYLASLGLPVPAGSARLFLPDRLFTHFEREEDISTLRGKLDEELVRIREILEQATGDGVVILNEIFAATTLGDAVYLGTEVLTRMIELGCLGICVTFVDELASLGPATVSMVALVSPDDPSQRTYKIVRKPADGRAYAWAIAEKYGLSYARLKNRIG